MYELIVALRESCPWCQKMKERLPAMAELAKELETNMRVVAETEIPAAVSSKYPGVPLCMFTDANGNVLVDKTLTGFMFGDDVVGFEKWMRYLARWMLAVRSDDV